MSSPNAEQARFWNDDAGPHWVHEERLFDHQLVPFGDAVVEALAARAGEVVLDVGCGFGTTALAVAARGARVHGVDISVPMIERACQRAAAGPWGEAVHFAVGDAQEDPLGGPYDAAVSRFGVMFFADPVGAFRNIADAVAPGGRLAFVCWQAAEANPWWVVPAMVLRAFVPDPPPPPVPDAPGPFAFADPDRVRQILTDAGWDEIEVTPFFTDRVRLGGGEGVEGTVRQTMANPLGRLLVAQTDGATVTRAADAMRDALAPHVVGDDVVFPGAAWVVTARR